MNHFTSKSFRLLLEKKTYPDWNSYSFADCEERHKASIYGRRLYCSRSAMPWYCKFVGLRAQTYTAFRRKILVCKTTFRTRNVIKTFEKLPNNTKSLAEPGTSLSWIITNYPVSSGKLIITPPTWFVKYWSRRYISTYLILESLCKTMLSFSSILGSSPLCWSRFTAVLNHSSFEQLSRNAAVKAEKR